MSLETLWNLQETFYRDRRLMEAGNTNPLYLLGRLEEEAKECKEAIEECMTHTSLDNCLNLLTENIRQEVADLLLFLLALSRNIGLTPTMLIDDGKEKIARNSARYISKDFQDLSADFPDQLEKSRSWDKRRGFSTQFYQGAV